MRAWRRRSRSVPALVLALGSLVAGCVGTDVTGDRAIGSGSSVPGSLAAPGTAPPGGASTAGPRPPIDARTVLAPLAVDDRPAPGGYRRELFPHWVDTDGDGCDGREQALRAADPSAEVGAGCHVLAGTWFSDYDGRTLGEPRSVDIDHVVPLAEAWRSGASGWTTDQRARFANDQANLWVSSASSNRSKGDRSPDEWRPPRRDVWCTYADRWVTVKVTYRLSATTRERDALGQMLDTCPEP